MMNGVALILVVFSLAGAGVWSPEPPKPGSLPESTALRRAAARTPRRRRSWRRRFPSCPTSARASPLLSPAKRRRGSRHGLRPRDQGDDLRRLRRLQGEARGDLRQVQGEGGPSARGRRRRRREGEGGGGGFRRESLRDGGGGCGEGPAGGTKAEEKAKELRRNVTERAVEVKKNLTDIVHRAHEVVYDAAAYVCTAETAAVAAAVAHLLAFATAYGACVWVTFVSSHVLAGALSRHQAMAYAVGGAALTAAGRSQRYLLLGSLVLVLVNMLFLEPKATKVMFEKMKMEKEEGRGRDMADLGMETTTSTTATATATPTTATFGVTRTTVTQEPLTDKEAAKNRILKLDRKLKALNTYSSFLNVLSLMGLTWHLVHLARGMQGSCEAVGAH
ncbi:unnamed protein product [Spirodela intermedia]|uniref:Uncharacterized protein n=1 Tax=Spirodela intermedia TaxID=51605 RepID=A0A7I8J1B0_SPIIN|nr:unnamed protein product [Spirodela intermedia]CAA6663839.1 unnamed protein product [Spirodela intermedia]